MRDAPFRRDEFVDALNPVLDSVAVEEVRDAVRCEGVDKATLEGVDLHVCVDAAEGVYVPVFAVGG